MTKNSIEQFLDLAQKDRVTAIWPMSDLGGVLNTAERETVEAVIELCRQARERLQPDAPFRLRVLIDMTLLELGKELARLTGGRAP